MVTKEITVRSKMATSPAIIVRMEELVLIKMATILAAAHILDWNVLSMKARMICNLFAFVHCMTYYSLRY